tara:strand:- start:225 stop:2090 length:1866 start_codon:yes stop_codon:yes gene_type:complete
MATHDYVIANGTGAAVRSDLNNALAAIVSNNSSSTQPATRYAYQLWADTNLGRMKIRNSANDAWISLFELDGTQLMEDGTAGSPGLAFKDDLDTGVHSPAADHFGITTGGTQRVLFKNDLTVFNDGGNDVDFRVESDGQSHCFFINGGTNKVGIAESSPEERLHVNGNIQVGSSSPVDASYHLAFNANRGAADQTIGQVKWMWNDTNVAAIHGKAGNDTTNKDDGEIVFFTSASGGSMVERMRIDQKGRTIIGASTDITANDTALLQVVDVDQGPKFVLARNDQTVASGNLIGEIRWMGNDDSGYQDCATIRCEAAGTHGNNDKPSRLEFATTPDNSGTPVERVRIDHNGNVGFNQTSVNATRKVEIVQPSSYSSALRVLPEGASGDNATIEFFAGVSHFDLSVTHSTDALKFQRNGSELMRLTNLGQLNVFTSSTSGIQARNNQPAGTTHSTFIGRHSATTTLNGTVSFKVFTNGNVQNTNNSYGSLSDIKLKENIVDAASQWEDIKGIRVRKYNFKEETGHETFTQLGVIAQEVETVSPGLVTELPDSETVEVPVLDENGEAVLDRNGEAVVNTEERNLDTTTKSVNYSVLYMKAVKALQEAMDRIETLESKVAALEAE